MPEFGPTESAGERDQPTLEVSYYTDPLCCWSWGFEPQLRRLRYAFAGRIAWRLRMGGMIDSWETFSDPLNDVHRSVQMGPLATEVAAVTGMPIFATVWVDNPPVSSWPSCLAVKAAGLQSPGAADVYLRLLREALMLEGRNISRLDTLIALGYALAEARPELFDADRFAADITDQKALRALEEDVREAKFRGIGRFPALQLRRPGVTTAWLVGWRPWMELLTAVRAFAPQIGAERPVPDAATYAKYWGGVTEKETAVALPKGSNGTTEHFNTLTDTVPGRRTEAMEAAW